MVSINKLNQKIEQPRKELRLLKRTYYKLAMTAMCAYIPPAPIQYEVKMVDISDDGVITSW